MSSNPKRYQRFFADLKRRQVFKVAAVYGVVAFAVLQAGDLLIAGLGLPEMVLGAATVLVILGFPIALVLAWAFELTPEGVRRTEAAASAELAAIVAQPKARRWPSGLFALAGTILLVLGVWWTMGRGGGGDSGAAADNPPPNSIAVLPFLNLSADTADEYFSDGVTEEIITALSRLRDLRVVSRSATFRYKGRGVDPREVGRDLGVGTILEGSVRKEGDRIRITAQLIDVADGFHIWSENYDRRYADIFEVQDDVATRIADALQLNLTESEAASLRRRPTDNLEAFELYSKARAQFYKYTPEGNAAALSLYERALAIDPDYALALAGLSLCQSQYINSGWSEDPEWLSRAEANARRALEIDPQLAEAHFALGFVYEQRSRKLRSQEPRRWYDSMAESMSKALALNPNHAHAHDSQADVLLRHEGRLQDALAEYEVALRLDPFLLPAHLNAALALFHQGQWAEAERRLRDLLRDYPEVGIVHNALGAILLAMGRYREAAESFRLATASAPTLIPSRTGLAAALMGAGDPAAASKVAERLASADAQGPLARAGRAYILALIALQKGDTVQAIERLRDAASQERIGHTGLSYRAALAEVYFAAGRHADATEQFEIALANEPFRKTLHYKMGLALEAAGDAEGAAAEYRRFLDAWQDADAEVPYVAQAKARLAALQRTGA